MPKPTKEQVEIIDRVIKLADDCISKESVYGWGECDVIFPESLFEELEELKNREDY